MYCNVIRSPGKWQVSTSPSHQVCHPGSQRGEGEPAGKQIVILNLAVSFYNSEWSRQIPSSHPQPDTMKAQIMPVVEFLFCKCPHLRWSRKYLLQWQPSKYLFICVILIFNISQCNLSSHILWSSLLGLLFIFVSFIFPISKIFLYGEQFHGNQPIFAGPLCAVCCNTLQV